MGWIDAEDYFVVRVVRFEEQKATRTVKGWVINRTDNSEHGRGLGGVYETKKEAVKNAKRLCKRNSPAKLYIEKMDGETADIRTYT